MDKDNNVKAKNGDKDIRGMDDRIREEVGPRLLSHHTK